MLLFKKKFLAVIRAGEKTQTVRLWPFARMRAGQRSYIPGVGYIGIDAVDAVSLEELTQVDAIRDGFATPEDLRREIVTLYAEKLDRGYGAFRIAFHILPAEEQVKRPSDRGTRRKRSRTPHATAANVESEG